MSVDFSSHLSFHGITLFRIFGARDRRKRGVVKMFELELC